MHDTVSRYRVARLALFPPQTAAGPARYTLIANTIRRGVPSAKVLVDGFVSGVPVYPSTEELLEAFDSAIRGNMLFRG